MQQCRPPRLPDLHLGEVDNLRDWLSEDSCRGFEESKVWYVRCLGSSFHQPVLPPRLLTSQPSWAQGPKETSSLLGGMLGETSEEGGPLPEVVCGSP